MAGDWIKMRPALLSSPKVNGIARSLQADPSARASLGVNSNVTRNVMRSVTVASLLCVWGAANEHTTDGTFTNADLLDIDDIAGVPGFATAMQAVGWLVFDEEAMTVTLPNFTEYNTSGKNRAAEKNAERQRRYRERKKAEAAKSNVTGNVTNDATRNDREEKRREENNKQHTHRGPATEAGQLVDRKRPMTHDWVPDREALAGLCQRGGVNPKVITPAVISEFRNYWAEEPGRVYTDAQWLGRLITHARRAPAQRSPSQQGRVATNGTRGRTLAEDLTDNSWARQ